MYECNQRNASILVQCSTEIFAPDKIDPYMGLKIDQII